MGMEPLCFLFSLVAQIHFWGPGGIPRQKPSDASDAGPDPALVLVILVHIARQKTSSHQPDFEFPRPLPMSRFIAVFPPAAYQMMLMMLACMKQQKYNETPNSLGESLPSAARLSQPQTAPADGAAGCEPYTYIPTCLYTHTHIYI